MTTSYPPTVGITYNSDLTYASGISSTITSKFMDPTYIFNTGDATTSSDMTVVSRSEYEELQADSKLLYALIDEGVEEWEGYDRAVLNV